MVFKATREDEVLFKRAERASCVSEASTCGSSNCYVKEEQRSVTELFLESGGGAGAACYP